MRTFDLSPLFRSSIGFERLSDMLDQAGRVETMTAWPPYDIEKTGADRYRITLAVAGFAPDEIELVQHDTRLAVTGQRREAPGREAEGERHYLHRGIAGRGFRQTFDLADHVTVTEARLEHGLLRIDLVREVPEAQKPRRIAIGPAGTPAPEIADRPPERAALAA